MAARTKQRSLRWVTVGKHLHAGDTLVVDEGRIRKFYHICELQIHSGNATIIYDVPGGTDSIKCQADDQVLVRR